MKRSQNNLDSERGPGRHLHAILLLLLCLVSCTPAPEFDRPAGSATSKSAPTPIAPGQPTPSPSASSLPTPAVNPAPDRRPDWMGKVEPPPPITAVGPAPNAVPAPSDLHLTIDDVVLYPGPGLYSGDVVSFDITARNQGTSARRSITVGVYRQTEGGEEVIAERDMSELAARGLPRARMQWLWYTAGLEGEQTLAVRVDPDDYIQTSGEDQANNVVTLTVPILPAFARPSIEIAATWAMTTTDCCRLHYLTGTAAERDLEALVAAAEEAVSDVRDRSGVDSFEPLDVYWISRVMGRGAYSGDGLTLSYLDRGYARADLATQMRYQVARGMDWSIRQEGPPCPLLQEGLAVWVAGGYYQPGPIPEEASALVKLGRYIPLLELAEDFYGQSQEIAYLEGAAFIAYLIETYGWDQVFSLYALHSCSPNDPAGDLDEALGEILDSGLAALEQEFLSWLDAHLPTSDQERRLAGTLHFSEVLLRYQQLYDPGASFEGGTYPDPALGVRLSIEADFVRHPRTVENITLETMLMSAQEALHKGAYDQAEDLLAELNQALDEDLSATPLSTQYMAVVRVVAAAGYEAQRIELDGVAARVQAISRWPTLVDLSLRRTDDGVWQIE